ncbi:hypothetical protein EDD37DRAFT_511690 [Exophiala viscosa]|uniref:BRCT domain-containing protein n=1 Tax=Exophiala viscosa TaxID=2486360 RepID=A0AAN6DZY0_9EURO|nr:hypothetical protein EDD36DRAFT_462742 [Exophiala viscosa]KAI1622236.1 hypothetical protein EDD37DRAFT_511690 [Exophiala viscosa]
MGKTFRNIVLASTGDFGDKSDKIKNWVEHAGGRFSKEITKDVTHLVASQRAWKKYHPMVKEARRLRSIHIVKLDWLEDSLTSKTRKPLETAKYAFEQRKIKINKVRKRKRATDTDQAEEEQEQDQVEMVTQDHIDSKADADAGDQQKNKKRKTVSISGPAPPKSGTPKRRKQRKKTGTTEAEDWDLSKDARIEISARELENECTEFQKELGEAGYRPFTDGNGFTFLITLLRKDILKNRLERHRLKVRYAPYFSLQPATFYTICNQGPDRQRKLSDEGYFACPVSQPDMHTMPMDGAAMSSRPTLPPCPVPLYFFPKPYPYFHAPVVATSLPKYLTPSNPALRVHIPNPWAQTVQLFEYDPALNPNETMTCFSNEPPRKSYACYTVYTRSDQRYVSTLAPPGSTFDFAFAMFSKFFHKRVGVEWSDRHDATVRSERNMCGDGAGDAGFFEFFGPVVVKQMSNNTAVGDSVEARQRKPSVTMVVNCPGSVRDDQVDVKAKTPDGGW